MLHIVTGLIIPSYYIFPSLCQNFSPFYSIIIIDRIYTTFLSNLPLFLFFFSNFYWKEYSEGEGKKDKEEPRGEDEYK